MELVNFCSQFCSVKYAGLRLELLFLQGGVRIRMLDVLCNVQIAVTVLKIKG